MKSLLSIVLGMLPVTGFAATPANFYHCQSATASVSYVTESRAGKTLAITLDGVTHEGKNQEILDESTVVGHLLTLTIESVPDSHTDSVTVLLPDVNAVAFNAPVKFGTRLFATRALTTIAGPAFVDGVIQNNKILPLRCEATAAVF